MLPLQFKEYVLSQRVKRLKLKTLAQQSLITANKVLDEHNKHANTMNLSKLSKELKDCNPDNVKRADNIKELIEQWLNDLIAEKEELEQSHSQSFDKKSIIRIWNAKELAFHETLNKELVGII